MIDIKGFGKKLIDMKNPKKSKEEMKIETGAPPMQEKYPWGIRLNFGKDELI